MITLQVYCYGVVDWRHCSYIYISIAQNCSQIWALYILVLFYRATNMHLQPIRPLHKFLLVSSLPWCHVIEHRDRDVSDCDPEAALGRSLSFKFWVISDCGIAGDDSL